MTPSTAAGTHRGLFRLVSDEMKEFSETQAIHETQALPAGVRDRNRQDVFTIERLEQNVGHSVGKKTALL